MKEHFPPPPKEHDTDPDVTGGTRNIGAVPKLIPGPKNRPPLKKGTILDPDFRIDLTAPDAHEQLDKLADEVASRIEPDPDSYRDNEYPTKEELAEEEKEDAERDAEDAKDPFLAAYKGPPGGITDAQAKKIRDENAAAAGTEIDEGWEDEPTKTDLPKP